MPVMDGLVITNAGADSRQVVQHQMPDCALQVAQAAQRLSHVSKTMAVIENSFFILNILFKFIQM